MRAVVVVIQPLPVNDPLGLGQVQEQFLVAQLISQPVVEWLDVSILPGTPLGDKPRLHLGQRRTGWDTNSGPLSLRLNSGRPPRRTGTEALLQPGPR